MSLLPSCQGLRRTGISWRTSSSRGSGRSKLACVRSRTPILMIISLKLPYSLIFLRRPAKRCGSVHACSPGVPPECAALSQEARYLTGIALLLMIYQGSITQKGTGGTIRHAAGREKRKCISCSGNALPRPEQTQFREYDARHTCSGKHPLKSAADRSAAAQHNAQKRRLLNDGERGY